MQHGTVWCSSDTCKMWWMESSEAVLTASHPLYQTHCGGVVAVPYQTQCQCRIWPSANVVSDPVPMSYQTQCQLMSYQTQCQCQMDGTHAAGALWIEKNTLVVQYIYGLVVQYLQFSIFQFWPWSWLLITWSTKRHQGICSYNVLCIPQNKFTAVECKNVQYILGSVLEGVMKLTLLIGIYHCSQQAELPEASYEAPSPNSDSELSQGRDKFASRSNTLNAARLTVTLSSAHHTVPSFDFFFLARVPPIFSKNDSSFLSFFVVWFPGDAILVFVFLDCFTISTFCCPRGGVNMWNSLYLSANTLAAL